jgi:hypothetical protein
MMVWRDTPFEVVRYAGVLFLFPLIYYFNHPEPYHLRAVDPLLVILGSQGILMVRERVRMRSRGRRLLSVADRVQVPAMD